MSSYVKLATEAGEQYLKNVAEVQEAFLKNVATFTAQATVPPAVAAFAAAIPTPQEIAEVNFAFSQKLLKQQKEFTEKLFAAAPASKS